MKKLILSSIIAALLLGAAFAGSTITIKGSDTLVRLGQRWAEEYMKLNEGTVIQVSGGGSGTGIAALINGTTDICEASRDMKEKEYELAKKNGIEPFRVSVALDGIAVFLHIDNPVERLSIPQLKGIYTGQITNWKEVGGPDAHIILYGRENNSGTYASSKSMCSTRKTTRTTPRHSPARQQSSMQFPRTSTALATAVLPGRRE